MVLPPKNRESGAIRAPLALPFCLKLHIAGQASRWQLSGQNLAAVGSSHSLAETVNLGTVTAAGLIGTLHGVHLLFFSIMLDRP